MNKIVENAPFGVLVVDAEGAVTSLNCAARDLLDIEAAAVEGTAIEQVFPESVAGSVPRAVERSPASEQTIEEYYPELDTWFEVAVVPDDETITIYVQDVTERHQTEQLLANREGDLERLTMINDLISAIIGELVGATTREEIANTICDRLGEAEMYEFAWVGEREVGSDEIVVRAASGATGRTLDAIETSLADQAEIPERQAIETGRPDIVQPLGGASRLPEDIRRAAFADGLQSVLAIPLTYGSTVYGVVGVYTATQDAFPERARTSFKTVGEMAGFAVNAARHRNLLLSDTVVELTIQITDSDAPLLDVAREHDATLTLDGLVAENDTVLSYLTVDGAAPDAITSALTDNAGVMATRTVRNQDDGGAVEARLTPETPLGRVATQGATIQAATYDKDGGELKIECSPDDDVRRIANEVTRAYDASVIAKREREREITTAGDLRAELGDRLTDRQETALRTAFFANYFESPRGSAADEVAQSLDITGPTLLHHLRAAQRKLLAEFFETAGDEPPDR